MELSRHRPSHIHISCVSIRRIMAHRGQMPMCHFCLELMSSNVDVAYLVLTTRHEQGSNPLERQSKILAQDHTEAASSWLGACELMPGHTVWYRFYFFFISPSLSATSDEKDSPVGVELSFLPSLFARSFWLSVTVIWDWGKHRCYELETWSPKKCILYIAFFPNIYKLGNSGSLLSGRANVRNPTDFSRIAGLKE